MMAVSCLTSFRSSDDGAIAPIFGVSIIALALSAGIAIDYSRTYSIHSSLQNDLDAAVLGAAAQAADLDVVEEKAESFFATNWKAKHGTGPVTIEVTQIEERRIRGVATTLLPTTLMKLGGFESISLTAITEVELANQNVEVALVLDTTGSMAGPKLTALKNASKTLVETAFEKPDAAEHVKISLVPFAQYVNVGMEYRNASWMNVPADSSIAHDGCGFVSPVIGTSNCHTETFTGNNDGIAYSYESEVCDYEYGPSVYQCTPWTETVTWNGCAGPRNYPLNTLDEQYETRIPGAMNAWCGSPMTPLSNDDELLEDNIDNMVAVGETYIPTGLMWGWRALSKHEPFDQGVGYGEKVDGMKVRKVLVLMTDGMNTKSPIYPSEDPINPSHDGSDAALANTLTAELCTNIKDKGIAIYSVAFEVPDDSIKDILRTCASDAGKFFDAPEASTLEQAFANIGADLAPIRIAR